jgi:hypothetical protein
MAVKDGAKGEFEILEEQLAKASKEARGKKFVLDRYGQTVIIGKVDPTHLPPFNASLQAAIKKEEDMPKTGARLKSTDDSEEPQNQQNAGKKRFVRVAGSRGVDETSFQPNLSLASTLSGAEAIQKMGAGVTLRSRFGERSGETIQEDAKHISKKTYLAKTASIQPALAQIDDFDPSYGTSGTLKQNNNQTKSKSQKSIRFDPNTVKNINSLPDLDPFEGSRRVQVDTRQFDVSDDELGLGPTSTKGSGGADMILPKKPDTRQKHVVEQLVKSPDGGNKPRDRDLTRNMKAVADRKHLPAPPVGLVGSHGNYGMLDQNSKGMNNSISGASLDQGSSYSSEWFQRRRN